MIREYETLLLDRAIIISLKETRVLIKNGLFRFEIFLPFINARVGVAITVPFVRIFLPHAHVIYVKSELDLTNVIDFVHEAEEARSMRFRNMLLGGFNAYSMTA